VVDWGATIRDAVLARTGANATGGAGVVADLLSRHCWSDNTWATRSSQWRKWVGFCGQDDRNVFPASEGDVLAYVGFLKMEGSVSAASLPQYLSAVSRCHELAGVASPTKTILVRSLVRAYDRSFDLTALVRPTRVGLSGQIMRRVVVQLGLATPVPTSVRAAAMVVFMFVFGCRASTAMGLRGSDIEVTEETVTAVLVHRKGKRTQDPLVLDYARNPTVAFAGSPLALLRRWADLRPTTDAFFSGEPLHDVSYARFYGSDECPHHIRARRLRLLIPQRAHWGL
jgi:integrase